jgi:hypothetical protein
MWTKFMDMHSGGDQKEDQQYIYIEAPESEAKVIFYNRFGHNPERVTCTCCGNDYSISEEEDLHQLTGYDRGCAWGYFLIDGGEYVGDDAKYDHKIEAWVMGGLKVEGRYIEKHSGESYRPYMTMHEYKKNKNVLIIKKSKIKPEEMIGDIPTQGYVWVE